VVPHRFVQVDGGTTGGVKACHPHGADKDDSHLVAGVFEFYVQSRFFFGEALAVGFYKLRRTNKES
jgi:hypothetical protein